MRLIHEKYDNHDGAPVICRVCGNTELNYVKRKEEYEPSILISCNCHICGTYLGFFNGKEWDAIDETDYCNRTGIALEDDIFYTTYFAKLKSLPDDIVPISISGKSPDGYNGLEYKLLAPKWDVYSAYKKDGDIMKYCIGFRNKTLSPLLPSQVWLDLKRLSGGKKFAIVCYEKSGAFCHRIVSAEWMGKPYKEFNGIII